MPRPRKHDPDAILDAARALVLEGGARSAGIAAIAAAAGAPVGTLYHHFGSRQHLLTALWFRALERFQAGFLAAPTAGAGEEGSGVDPVQAGVEMALATVRFARAWPQDHRLLLDLRREDLFAADPSSDLQERLDAINAPVRDAIVSLARTLAGDDPRGVSRVTVAVVDVPRTVVRRHASGEAMPDWLEAEVAAATRALLSAARSAA